jgi:hypothetical protein
MVCTSIGLTVKGVPVVGVIYNPFLDQLVRTLLHLLIHLLLCRSSYVAFTHSPRHPSVSPCFPISHHLSDTSCSMSLRLSLTGYRDIISSTDE